MTEFGIEGAFSYSGDSVDSQKTSGAISGQWYIVLEYISRGTLLDLMYQTSKLAEPEAKFFFE
jgi:serine/threonine protein kinase